MTRRITIAALTVVTLLAAHPGLAQEWTGTGRVSGRVTGPDGEPVVGAKVTYHLPGNPDAGPQPFVTDENGEYRFAGLAGTSWMVYVEAEGYLPAALPKPTFVYEMGTNDPLRIQLQRIPEEMIRAKKRAEANVKLQRGDDLRAAGDYAAAREEYLDALDELSREDQPIVLAALADTWLREGDVEQAHEYLEQALAIDPNHAPSMIGMMTIEVDRGNYTEAEELLSRLPDDQEIHPTLMMKLAQGYYNADQMEQAKLVLDRTIRDHPNEAIAYYFRGLTELNLNEVEGARTDLERFLELAPDHPEAEAARGIIEYLPTLGG